ncbi:MAG: hypothetical protein ABI718_16200 [Acidobacteriota bacterium]
MHPATREFLGEIAYVLAIITVAGIIARRFLPQRTFGARQIVLTLVAFSVAASASLGVAVIVNARWNADFCNYFILGLTTFAGSLLTLGMFSRRQALAPFAWSTMLVVATVEVLLIPWFLLGFA